MEVLESLIEMLPQYPQLQRPQEPWYQWASAVSASEAQRLFASTKTEAEFKGPLRDIQFPFHKMGNITSLHLFGLDELILFSFYWANRSRYKRVLDLGGNIGLHSIVMDRCGFQVSTYEPDPENQKVLLRNLDLNQCKNVKLIPAAVSTENGKMTFTRVLGNMTGSHLKGSKATPYGDIEEFDVPTVDFREIVVQADFVKMDIEGQEAHVILSTEKKHWLKTDCMMEVGTAANAEMIFNHFKKIGVDMYAQKVGWKRVENLSEMPTSYRDGSLFVTCGKKMSWHE